MVNETQIQVEASSASKISTNTEQAALAIPIVFWNPGDLRIPVMVSLAEDVVLAFGSNSCTMTSVRGTIS